MFLNIGLLYQFSILAWLDNNETIFQHEKTSKTLFLDYLPMTLGGVIEVKKIDWRPRKKVRNSGKLCPEQSL